MYGMASRHLEDDIDWRFLVLLVDVFCWPGNMMLCCQGSLGMTCICTRALCYLAYDSVELYDFNN